MYSTMSMFPSIVHCTEVNNHRIIRDSFWCPHWQTLCYLMDCSIDFHRNDEICIADGLQNQNTHKHIHVQIKITSRTDTDYSNFMLYRLCTQILNLIVTRIMGIIRIMRIISLEVLEHARCDAHFNYFNNDHWSFLQIQSNNMENVQ